MLLRVHDQLQLVHVPRRMGSSAHHWLSVARAGEWVLLHGTDAAGSVPGQGRRPVRQARHGSGRAGRSDSGLMLDHGGDALG